MAVYGYVRLSTVEQAGGTSLDEQRRKILCMALIAGVDGTRTYDEPGVSGSTPLEAP